MPLQSTHIIALFQSTYTDFKLGEPWTEETADGRTTTTVATVDGNKLIKVGGFRYIYGEIDGWIDRQMDKQIDEQMDRQIDGQINRWIDRDKDRQIDRQMVRQIYSYHQLDRQIYLYDVPRY